MKNLTLVLGVLAGALHGIAYLLYAIQSKVGQSSPKSASWGIWVFLTVVNTLTFGIMTGNWVLAFQFMTGSVACLAVFLYMLAAKKLAWPTPAEWWLFSLGVLATMVWWIFRNAAGANMIVLIALTISFIPMYKDLWIDPRKEMPRPWVLWTIAFLVTAVNIVINWKGQPLSLAMPIGGAILHGTVAYLSRRERVHQFYPKTF